MTGQGDVPCLVSFLSLCPGPYTWIPALSHAPLELPPPSPPLPHATFFFFQPCPRHVKVPRPGNECESQQ